jgi:hypothetical protein
MKGIISVIVPIGASTAAYFAIRKNKKMSDGAKIATVAGTGLGAFLLVRTIASYAGTNIKNAPVDYGQIPVLPGGVKWDPDPLAKEIAENFEGYNLYTYPETAAKISALQPEQLKLLYNHYNNYYAQDFPTLTQLIENEWSDWSGEYNKAVQRLKSVGLNDNQDNGDYYFGTALDHFYQMGLY